MHWHGILILCKDMDGSWRTKLPETSEFHLKEGPVNRWLEVTLTVPVILPSHQNNSKHVSISTAECAVLNMIHSCSTRAWRRNSADCLTTFSPHVLYAEICKQECESTQQAIYHLTCYLTPKGKQRNSINSNILKYRESTISTSFKAFASSWITFFVPFDSFHIVVEASNKCTYNLVQAQLV